ncbi:MAG: hypothetical protein C0448_08615 [Sphingobacteriaceae bacterium]|nr:hypothetical protein [Sphingobacteriaceae bacterium]
MKKIFFIILIPFIGFSQNTRKVFVETGVSTFKPFVAEERIVSSEYQNASDLKYTYKTTQGFFIKCGVEILHKTEKKFNVTVPMSIGYKEFNKIIVQEGYAYGCFSNFNGTQTSRTSSNCASIMIGPKFNFNTKKITVFTALNVNADLFFLDSETTEYKPINSETYTYNSSTPAHVSDFTVSTSLQLGVDYKVSSRLTLGVSCDNYFFNFNSLINGNTSNSILFNNGYGKQSLYTCSGIRAAYSF